jgi:hypothetical protein
LIFWRSMESPEAGMSSSKDHVGAAVMLLDFFSRL